MHYRHIASAAFLSLFTLHASLFSQSVAQPEISGTAGEVAPAAIAAETGHDYQAINAASGVRPSSDLNAAAPVAVPVATTPAAATTGTAATGDEIVNMSPFSVTGSRDVGYQAFDTTSGSRLKTELRDTAASVSPFTPEFLDDIGATTVDDLITYAGNAESEYEDGMGFNNNADRWAGNSNSRARIRGIPASTMVDYAEYNAPVDMYNLGRAEIASGPNSILFGMGAQGGIINYTRKHADAQRTKLSLRNTIGTWTSPAVSGIPYERFTLDYNLVLKPRVLGFRLMGLYQDGANNSWRYWQFAHDRRISPAVMIHPFQNTTIHLTYQIGRLQNATTRQTNAADGVTGWLNANTVTNGAYPDNPIVGTFGTGQSIPGVLVNIAGNNIDNYVYVNNTGETYDFRQAYQAAAPWVYSQAAHDTTRPDGSQTAQGWSENNNNQIRLPSDLSSYYYSTVGPAGRRDQRFQDWSAVIQQAVGNFNFELGYYHSKTSNSALSDTSIDGMLQGDPNAFISPFAWTGATGVVSNPNVGQMYMESSWFKNTLINTNDSVRLTTEYSLQLGKWGRHRIINLLEHTNNESRTTQTDEILADDNGRAIVNVTNPDAAQNLVTRRNYVTPGDFTTYYDGDPRVPLSGLVIGDRVFHSAWVSNQNRQSHVKRATNSVMLALQSWWLNNKLSTMFGGRVDFVDLQRERLARIVDPTDPRIVDGSHVWNEYDFSGKWWPHKMYTPFTFSAGGVYHITQRISPFINYSTNRGLPYTDGRTVLPDGDLPPITKGQSLDYGVMLDVMGDGKWSVRLTRFDTKQIGDAAITPAGMGNATNPALGATNLFNVFDALYFLTPTGQTGDTSNLTNNTWPTGSGPGQGPMHLNPGTPYAAPNQNVTSYYAVNGGLPPQYNAAEIDVHSRGYELEITANPTKSLSIRFLASYSDLSRENLFGEIFNYFDTNVPQWLKLADPNRNGGYDAGGPPQYNADGTLKPGTGVNAYTVVMPGNTAINMTLPNGTQQVTSTPSLYNYILYQVYNATPVVGGGGSADNAGAMTGTGQSARTGLNAQLNTNSGQLASRPYKFNVTVRYKFPNNFFKGLAVGASVRYQSFNYMPDPFRSAIAGSFTLPMTANDPIPQNLGIDQSVYNDPSRMIKGNSLLFWDVFATYKCKLFGGKTTMTVQLNIKNIFNQCVITTGRLAPVTYVDSGESDALLRRVYLNAPRTYRLTVGFDF